MKINRKTSILDLLANYPEAKEVLVDYGLDCANCLGAMVDDLESVARANNIEVEKLIIELNGLKNNEEEE
ncbi:hypothetical protein JCM16358_04090 [Halanaerocella petrolearia]